MSLRSVDDTHSAHGAILLDRIFGVLPLGCLRLRAHGLVCMSHYASPWTVIARYTLRTMLGCRFQERLGPFSLMLFEKRYSNDLLAPDGEQVHV